LSEQINNRGTEIEGGKEKKTETEEEAVEEQRERGIRRDLYLMNI